MAQTSSEEEDASQAESDESSLKLQPTSSKHAEKLFTPQTPPKPKTPKKTSPPKKKTSPPKEVLNVFKFPSQVASEAPTVEEESPARTRAEKRQKIQELKEYRDKVEEELETAKEKFKKRRDGAHRFVSVHKARATLPSVQLLNDMSQKSPESYLETDQSAP